MTKQTFRFTFFLLICLSIPLTATAQTVDLVYIPDPNLGAAIGIAPIGEPIAADEMARLTYLYALNANISDLTGLEFATNLITLLLGPDWVDGEGWVNSNSVSDLSPLAGLTNLTYLRLGDNSISDLSPLAGLTNLTALGLGYNSISDISPVAGLTNLTALRLGYNSISDLSPLAGLTNLTALNLWANSISDISPVAGLTNLTDLGLGYNSISDLSPLAGLTNLTYLGLWDNSISDLSPLAGLTNLTELRLGGNSISDISPVAGLTNLTVLSLRDNSISDISPVAGLTNLIGLFLGTAWVDGEGWVNSNSISDISPVAGLTNLTYLQLEDNSISDISPVAGLTNLTELSLGGNSISDISPVAGLTNLTYLGLGDNSISDISPLVANTELGYEDFVNVGGNPLNALFINTYYIRVLQSRGVIVAFDGIAAQPDVNGDGRVNIFDLASVASQFGNQGQNLAADVNHDGVVDVRDLVLVASIFGDAAAAPSAQPQTSEILTAAEVRQWLTDAKALEVRDPVMERGVVVLQQLLVSLTPAETELLANYPNPFNPETWIPYRLAEDAFVTLTIYDQTGHVVRTLDVGHQTAAVYENRSRAIYWDGRNQVGETVASGVYFYHLSAGDYSATRKMLILK